MSLKITQSLIDQAYEMLKSILKHRNINAITTQTLENVIGAAISVSIELLNAKTKHVYLIELATIIVRKLVDDPDITSPEVRSILHVLLESNILVLFPKVSCKSCTCFSFFSRKKRIPK